MEKELLELLNKSYAPYSNFKVASIVTMKDGTTFSGVNVENASFGATVCAERVAILKAVSNGYRKGDFKSIAIMVDKNKISSCCFLCRQVMAEFFDLDSEVVFYNKNLEKQTHKLEELIPFSFDKGDLL